MGHIEESCHIEFAQIRKITFPDHTILIRLLPGIGIVGNNDPAIPGQVDISFHPVAIHLDRRRKSRQRILGKMLGISTVTGYAVFQKTHPRLSLFPAEKGIKILFRGKFPDV